MMEYSTLDPWQMMDENGLVYEQGSLIANFQDVLDRRKARGKRYSLVTLLVLVFLAKLSGMDNPSAIADWCQAPTKVLAELLHLSYPKLPSHSTIRRLFAKTIDG